MSDQEYSLQRLLALRKLTREVSEMLRGQLKEYLATLAPALRPRSVLGDYIQGTAKETARAPEKAFKELQDQFQSVIGAKPFNLQAELAPPLEMATTALEPVPVEYAHTAQADGETKNVTVTSPLRWVLAYSGFAPQRLRDVLAAHAPAATEIRQFVLHYTVLHVVLSKQPGIGRLFQALRFPISTGRLPELGELPVSFVCAPVSTLRPPDHVIVESTELSGKDVFEEIVDLENIHALRDPLREQLFELARSHGEDLG